MRRATATLAALGALSALAAVPATAAPAAVPARVQVVEKEYSITLSRLRVHTGRVIVQLVNFGMDNHDLVIQSNAKKTMIWRFDPLAPEGIATKTLAISPGRYTLSCSLPGHRALGMVATLTVTR